MGSYSFTRFCSAGLILHVCRFDFAGCRLQVAGCRLQVAGAGCRLQVAGCGLQSKKQLIKG